VTDRRTRPELARLWVAAHQELADRAAHELRNALNGVAVNLEVVRSRLGKKGVDLGTVTPFATTASNSMEELTAFSEALLALARSPRQPADVGAMLKSMFAVLEPVARRTDEGIRFQAPATGDGVTDAAADVTRLVLLRTALEGVRTGASVTCSVTPAEDRRFTLQFTGWFPIEVPDAIVSVARGADILLDAGSSDGVRWTFPAYTG
jgi:hypothetical protein